MTEQGFVLLHRKSRENSLWNKKPFDMWHAWEDLILSANHKDAKVIFGMETRTIERGSFIATERDLANRWGWSKSQVHRYLRLLQKENMIRTKTAPKANQITIEKYNKYQSTRTTVGPILDHNRTTAGPKQRITNNDNNKTFAQFWEKYPVKKDKKKAQAAWAKADLPDISIILNAIEKQSKEKVQLMATKQFCPSWKLPTTWINGECWNDEPLPTGPLKDNNFGTCKICHRAHIELFNGTCRECQSKRRADG